MGASAAPVVPAGGSTISYASGGTEAEVGFGFWVPILRTKSVSDECDECIGVVVVCGSVEARARPRLHAAAAAAAHAAMVMNGKACWRL
jgi:hypothetical protein